ncbi:protein TolA [Cognatilysobacter segetis]|uniref:protein TolA n=1 Tax=Cognatilysobacter segetis TaxID=2492394 RepID=UPI00106059D7|nr:protein TolA [Lysobacter segetis]
MRARPADDATAIALAVALHVGLALLLWFAMRPSEVTDASAGGMAADVVDVGQLSAAMQRTLRDRPEPAVAEPMPTPVEEIEPEPEPAPPTPPVQAVVPTPAPVDQQQVVEQPTPVKATETTPQEEKRRQVQVDLSKPVVEAPPQPDASAAKAAEAQRRERERLDQLAEIRRRRAAAAREALAAEARLEQLTAPRGGSAAQEAARSDAAASGAGGTDDGLKARYAAALQAAITSKWVRPDNIPSGAVCRLVIRQLPGGEVIDAEVGSPCVYDEAGRRSIEAAVLKAQPLPYTGFEKVFARQLTLNFRAP